MFDGIQIFKSNSFYGNLFFLAFVYFYQYYSEVQLSSKERLNLEIKKLREEFQTHEYDSGSPQVQSKF